MQLARQAQAKCKSSSNICCMRAAYRSLGSVVSTVGGISSHQTPAPAPWAHPMGHPAQLFEAGCEAYLRCCLQAKPKRMVKQQRGRQGQGGGKAAAAAVVVRTPPPSDLVPIENIAERLHCSDASSCKPPCLTKRGRLAGVSCLHRCAQTNLPAIAEHGGRSRID